MAFRPIVALLIGLLVGCTSDPPARECQAWSDCPAGNGCDRGICRPVCVDDGNCSDGHACVEGLCVAPIDGADGRVVLVWGRQ